MTTNPPTEGDSPTGSNTITLHILCPSIPAPGRFTLHDQPLSETIAQIKARITESLPSRPGPAQQRLIYRGKPLADDRATVASVLGPIDGSPCSIHLVLPPAPTATSSSTSTSSTGSPRLGQFAPSTSIASHTTTTTTFGTSTPGIRYRGQAPLPPDDPSSANPQVRYDHAQRELDAIVERWRSIPPPGSEERLSALREEIRRGSASMEEISRGNSSHNSSFPSDSRATLSRYNSTGPLSQNNTNLANGRLPTTPAWNSSSPLTAPNNGGIPAMSQASSEPIAAQNNGWPRRVASNPYDPSLPAASNPAQVGAHSASSPPARPESGADRYLGQIQTWQSISQHVVEMETMVSQCTIPSINTMFRIRTELQTMLAERQGQGQDERPIHSIPLEHSLFPSAASVVQAMLDRVARLYERVDQMALMQQAHQGRLGMYSPALASAPVQAEPSRVYLATHPDGRQSLVLPPATTFRTSPEDPSLQFQFAPAPEPPMRPNAANVAAVQNAVRQALVNQQQRRDANGPGIGRYLSRVWMFIRMYFFCYMISDAGTWTRIFLVTCAVLVALLADTDIPQRIHRAVVTPVQRHLEGLAHMGGPADQSTQATNQGAGNRGNAAPQGMSGEVLHFLRRAERSIVLLLASLVPGIGERQVEARNAAEAERARREEQEQQEREREREQAQQTGGETGPEGEQPGPEAAAAAAATAIAGATAAPVEQPEQAAA